MKNIQHIQLQVNQQKIQLPLPKSSASSSILRGEPKIPATFKDESKDCEVKSQSQAEKLKSTKQQNVPSAYTNMRIQARIQVQTSLTLSNEATAQFVTGMIRSMARGSDSSFNGLNAQNWEVPPGSTLTQHRRTQSHPAVAQQVDSVTVRGSGLQVAKSESFASQATKKQILIQSPQLSPGEPTSLATTAVSPETALAFNLDSSIVLPPSTITDVAAEALDSASDFHVGTLTVPPPSASEESKSLAAASSTSTEPAGNTLADLKANPGKENTSIPIPSEITSTDTTGLELDQDLLGSAGLESKHADGATKLEPVEPTSNEPENPHILTDSSVAGSFVVAHTCRDPSPPSHPAEASVSATHPSPGVVLTCSAPIHAPHSDHLAAATNLVLPSKVAAGSSATTAVCQSSKSHLVPPKNLDSEADSNRDEALSLACTGGKEELVELLLSKGTDIELRDKKGLTPLMLAATAGHEKVVELLLNHGANIEAQSEPSKDTALALACSGGRLKVVELMVKRGANKENHNVNDYSPLTLAASGGHVDIIKLLLANGAEINSRTDSRRGLSPLMMAANNGHVAAVRVLLEMGSDVNTIIGDNGYTALTLACYNGKHEVVKILLENKAYVELRIKTGETPLQLSASRGYAEVGRVLLDYGADVNASPVPSSRDTALTLASDKGLVQLVALLLKNGAQVDVKNKKGNSALWLAANGGHFRVVELLCNAKADIDFKDNRKVSCLMAAFRKGYVKLVEWMVKRVTQFPSDEEISRIITTTVDNDLLIKCQLCMKVICAAKERQAAEANKRAAYLLNELDVEKKREARKRAAAAKKRDKKKLKKQEKRRAESDDIDNNNSHEQDKTNGDDYDKFMDSADSYTKLKTANPAQPPRNLKETEDGKSDKIEKKTSLELPVGDVSPTEFQTSKGENCSELEIQLKQTKKSSLPPESSVKLDAPLQLSNRDCKRMKENVSSDTLITTKSTVMQYPTWCTNNESTSKSSKSLTSTSVTIPEQPIKREEDWKEVVRRRPLTSQENSGSAAGTTKKNPPSDQVYSTLSVIHTSERCKMLLVSSNAIGRVIGYGGCNINTVEEISGAVIDVEKQRKGQDHRTVLIKGMPEYISQAEQLISVLVEEPEEEFKKLVSKFKAANEAAKASGTDIPAQACIEVSKSATGSFTSSTPQQVLPIPSAGKKEQEKLSPTVPPRSPNMNLVAPTPQIQPALPPSVSMIATSVACSSTPSSPPYSTSPVQDCFPFNSPFSKAVGTSVSGVNVVDPAKAPGYRGHLNISTTQSSLNLSSINETITFPTPHVLRPTGNCYLPPTPQQETIPTLGMEEESPPTSTASLVPALRMWRRRQLDEQIQQYSPQFDELSVPNLTPPENGPLELPGPTFSLAPGVGRPQRGRPQQPGLQYPPLFGDCASPLSFTPANFGFNAGMHVGPTDGADMKQLPDHMPFMNLRPDYSVPIGTSYRDMELMVNLYPGPDVMNCASDPSLNQPGLPEFPWLDETTRRVEDRHSTDNIGPWRTTRSGSFRE